ncbi:MAG: integrase core domain-containing protein [Candidatus Paceibacterota bacterium]
MKYQIYTTFQKKNIINQVESSKDKKRELIKLNISRSTYYEWKNNNGETKSKAPNTVWNKTPQSIEQTIEEYRLSGEKTKNSPMRIVENLEEREGYVMSESGVRSVLKRKKLNSLIRVKKRYYHIRPKAEKFLDVVCFDDVEFTRSKPRDTYILNFIDESSYLDLKSIVLEHRINRCDITKGLKIIKKKYGRYPKTVRCDNAQAHKSILLRTFCLKNNIKIDYITSGCPEENWPVESFHRNLNQDIIYQNGFRDIKEWQRVIDNYTEFHNKQKRLRFDPIQRTPHEIAFAYTTKLTQFRLKTKLQRKLHGQTSVQKWVDKKILSDYQNVISLSHIPCPKCA